MAPTRRAWLAAVAASASLAGCVGDDSDGDGDDESDGTDGAGGDSGDDSTGDGTDADDGSSDGGDDGTDGDGSDGDGADDAATVALSSHGDLGEILVNADGMTLYMFDADEQGADASSCTDGCLENWPPLTVESDATAGTDVEATLTTFERADGTSQVAANGWPLYYWQGDSEPGDATGQGVNDIWWVLDASGEPIRSSGGSSDGSGNGDGDGTPGY